MKRLGFLTLFVFVLGLLPSAIFAQEALSVGVTEAILEGESTSFTLAVTEGTTYLLAVNSTEFDTYVTVTDENDSTVADDDDGGPARNSLVVFQAPADGAYTVTVSSYDGRAGNFTITLEDTFVTLESGTAVEAALENGVQVFAYVAAEAPVNVTVDSGGTVDTSIAFISVGLMDFLYEEATDVNGVDPALQRIIFNNAGDTYYLVLVKEDAEAQGAVSVLLEETQLAVLGSEPVTFTFNDSVREDTLELQIEEGQEYLLTVTVDVPSDFNLYMEDTDPGQFFYGSYTFTNALGGTWRYVGEFTGTFTAQIGGDYYFSGESSTYTLTFEAVGE